MTDTEGSECPDLSLSPPLSSLLPADRAPDRSASGQSRAEQGEDQTQRQIEDTWHSGNFLSKPGAPSVTEYTSVQAGWKRTHHVGTCIRAEGSWLCSCPSTSGHSSWSYTPFPKGPFSPGPCGLCRAVLGVKCQDAKSRLCH